MAKLFWAGSQASFTVSNKQTDNSGVKNVTIDSAVAYYASSLLTGLTNTGAGVTADTVGTANFVSYIDKATIDIAPSIYVTWQSGGRTDSHSVGDITLYNPATKVSIKESNAVIYTDANEYPIEISATGKNDTPVANASTGKVKVVSDLFSSELLTNLGKTNVKSQIFGNLSSYFTADGEYGPQFVVSTTASSKPTELTLGEHSVSASSTLGKVFTLRNATKSIKVNDSTADTSIYVAAGQMREISYTVNPHVNGVAFSYALSFVKTPDSNYIDVESVAPAAGAEGKFVINTKNDAAGQSTTIQLKSTASATGEVLSPTVTIYITAANTEIFINVGDIYYMSVMDVETIVDAPDSSVATAEIVGENGAKRLKITGANVSGDTQQTSVTLASGTVITINVAHIDVTIA
jgi:hypothetical protein